MITKPVIQEEQFLIHPRTYHRPEIVIFVASLVTIATGLILSYGFHIHRTPCLAVLGTGGGAGLLSLVVFCKKIDTFDSLTSHDIEAMQVYFAKGSTLEIQRPSNEGLIGIDFKTKELNALNGQINDFVSRFSEYYMSNKDTVDFSNEKNIIQVHTNERIYILPFLGVRIDFLKRFYQALIVQTIRKIIHQSSNPT